MNIFHRRGMLKSHPRFPFLNTRFQLPKTITLCVKYVIMISVILFEKFSRPLNNYFNLAKAVALYAISKRVFLFWFQNYMPVKCLSLFLYFNMLLLFLLL